MSNPRNGALPAADVARILDNARIPHVLFGWWAVGCHGVAKCTQEIDFVLPDNQIEAAANALVATGHFHRCTDRHCFERTGDRSLRIQLEADRTYPDAIYQEFSKCNAVFAVAHDHLHLGSAYDYFKVVSLYAHSHLLWSLPEPTLDPLPSDSRTYMFTNNPQLPPRARDGSSGPWSELYPVKIPSHAALVEALFMLFCRDLGDPNELHETWLAMFQTTLGDFVDDACTLNDRMVALRRDINPRWLPALDPFLFPNTCTTELEADGLIRLRAGLLQNNELRDVPSHDLSDYDL
ncbi:hypothetical protein BDV18DRAFT_164385 [Aspergillus unguis]